MVLSIRSRMFLPVQKMGNRLKDFVGIKTKEKFIFDDFKTLLPPSV